ncbi:MAG: hypothetical protein PVF49_04505 [Anaerolineales bacterium]
MEILGIVAILLIAWIAFKVIFRLTIRLFTCGLLALVIIGVAAYLIFRPF